MERVRVAWGQWRTVGLTSKRRRSRRKENVCSQQNGSVGLPDRQAVGLEQRQAGDLADAEPSLHAACLRWCFADWLLLSSTTSRCATALLLPHTLFPRSASTQRRTRPPNESACLGLRDATRFPQRIFNHGKAPARVVSIGAFTPSRLTSPLGNKERVARRECRTLSVFAKIRTAAWGGKPLRPGLFSHSMKSTEYSPPCSHERTLHRALPQIREKEHLVFYSRAPETNAFREGTRRRSFRKSQRQTVSEAERNSRRPLCVA